VQKICSYKIPTSMRKFYDKKKVSRQSKVEGNNPSSLFAFLCFNATVEAYSQVLTCNVHCTLAKKLWETHRRATERRLPCGITCHPTQVNAQRRNPCSQTGCMYSIYLPSTPVLIIGVYLFLRWFRRQSPIHVIATRLGVEPATSRS